MIAIKMRMDANTITRGHASSIEKAVLSACDIYVRYSANLGAREDIEVMRVYTYDTDSLVGYAFTVEVAPDASVKRPPSGLAPIPRDIGNAISQSLGPFPELSDARFYVRIVESEVSHGSFQPTQSPTGAVEWSIELPESSSC